MPFENTDIVFMIPLYKEKENCKTLSEAIMKVMSESLSDYTYILFYVIAGDDGTKEYLDELKKENVTYLYEGERPTGLGNAYHRGYIKSLEYNPRMIISMDGDLNHDPELVPTLVAQFETKQFDGVIASRYISGGGYEEGVNIPYYKKMLSVLLNIIFSVLIGIKLKDKTTGYRLLSAPCVQSIVGEKDLPTDFSYLMYVYFLYKRKGFSKFLEVPQIHKKRLNGESKFNGTNAMKGYIKICLKVTYLNIKSLF